MKALPARVGDEDTRNGMSGMQKFDGEDLDCAARTKLQIAQQAQWGKDQMTEKAARMDSDRNSEDMYSELKQQQVNIQNTVQHDQDAARAQMRMETANFNKAMAADKRAKEDSRSAAEL